MPEFGQNLPALKRAAIARINAAIGEARRAYITVIPGQDMLYSAKEAEAAAYLAAPAPPNDMSRFPLMDAEIGLTAPSAAELAQVWLNMSDLWRQAARGLERIRLTAVYAIEAAPRRSDIDAAERAFRDALAAHTPSALNAQP